MADGVRVEGLTELVRACDILADEVPSRLRDGLKARVGDPVARDARALLVSSTLQTSATTRLKTADGIKAQVTRAGEVLVVQTLRKSRVESRRRHNWGKLQMEHGFLPALERNTDRTVRAIGELIDEAIHSW